MRALFRKSPSSWADFEREGEAAFAAGRFGEARDAFRDALNAAGGHPPGLRLARIRRMLGEALRELADYDAAFRECDAAHDTISTLVDADLGVRSERLRILVSGARVLTESGRYTEAEGLLQEAMQETDPDAEIEGALAVRSLADLRAAQAVYKESAELYRRALAAFECLAPERDRERCRAVNGCGLAAMNLDMLEEGEQRLRQGLDMRRKALPPAHPDIGESLHNVATVVLRRGRLEEAETLERSALALWKHSLGPEHPRLALSLGNLGAICQKRGRYIEADALYRQTLAIREASLGPRHPRLIVSLNNIATIARQQGRNEEAESLFRRSLELAREAYGEDHPTVARALNNLHSILLAQGKKEEAEECLRHAIDIWERATGESRDLGVSLSNLGVLLMAQGKDGPAEDAFLRSLAIQQKVLGADHPDLAPALNNLATLSGKAGKLERAESMYLHAEELRRKAGYAQSPETLVNLGEIARRQGRFAESRDAIQAAIDLVETSAGSGSPALARYLLQLGHTLRILGDYRSAVEAFRRSLAHGHETEGTGIVQRAITLMSLASALTSTGEIVEAEKAYRQGVALLEPAAETQPVLLAEMLIVLGSLLIRTDRAEEAESVLVRGQDLARTHLGDSHAIVRSANVWRGYAAIARGDLDAAETLLLAAFEPDANPGGAEERTEILALHGLRRVYSTLDRPVLRAGVLEQLIERRTAQGVSDSRIAAILWELATLRFEEGQYSGAAALYRRVQAVEGDITGAGFRACTAYYLGTCLWRVGDDAGADRQFAIAEARFRDASGPEGVGVLQCKATRMSFLVARGHKDEAREMAAQTERLAALPSMPATASGHAFGSLGTMYAACGDIDAAERAFRDSIAAWERSTTDSAATNAAATREMLERLLKAKVERGG